MLKSEPCPQSLKEAANQQRGSLDYFANKLEGNMNGLPRWKENRIHQEVHLAHLKHPKTSFNGDGAHGAYPLGRNGTSALLFEQTVGARSDKRTPNRTKGTRLPWMILRLALLAAGVAFYLWVYFGQFGIHR